MANWIPIAEAAEALKCTTSNLYQLIKTHNIPTEKRKTQVLRAYTSYIDVQHVDIDDLKRRRQESAEPQK